MSYFQQRAKELKEMGVYVPPSGEAIPGESYFQQRLREYNASPPGNIEQPQSEYIMKRRMGIQDKPIFDGPNLINVRQSPLAQEAAAYAASFPSAPEEPPDNRNEVQKTLDYIFKENPVSRVLNRPFAAAAAASVPDAPMMDRQGNIPGTSAREEFLKKNPMLSTGNETVDKVSDVAGNIGSYFLNPAGAGQGPIALYKAAEAAAAKYLPRVTEKVVEKLPNAGLTLSKDGTKLVESLASKGVREGAKEAAVAATYAVPRSLIEGESDPLEIAQNVAIEGSLGAATGFAAPFIGSAFRRTKDALTKKATDPEIPTSAYESAAGSRSLSQSDFSIPQESSDAAMRMDAPIQPRNASSVTTELPEGIQAMPRKGGNFGRKTEVNSLQSNRTIPDDIQAMSMQTTDGRQLLSRGDGTGKELVKRSDIIADLAKELKLPIRSGRYRYDAHGIFKIKPEVVRTKLTNDLPTVFHEVGHAMDKRYNLGASDFDNELLRLGRNTSAAGYPQDVVRSEGVAEFFRLMLTEPSQAKALAPQFYDRVMNNVPNKVRKILLKAQEQTQKYINQPILLKSMSEMSVGKKDPINLPSLDDIYTKFVDELLPIKRATQQLGEKGERLYRDFWLLRGVTGKAQAALKHGVMDQNFNKIGKSLEEILTPVKKNLDEFRSYIKDKRAIELDKRNIMTGSDLTIPERQANISDLEIRFPEFKEAHRELKQFQDHALNELIDSGILDPENVIKFKEMNQEYVPFFRDYKAEAGAERSKLGGSIGRGVADQNNPIRRIKGSDRDIIDPIESIIKNQYQYTAIAERNRTLRNFIDEVVNADGLGGLVEKVEVPMNMQQFKLEDLRSTLEKQGVKTDDLDMDAVINLFKPSNVIPGKDNIVSVFRNGKREFYQLDPDLYKAVTAADKDHMNFLMRAANFPTRLLRAGVVNTLEFWLRNMWRDQFEAAIKSPNGYVPWVDMIRGMAHVLRKTDTFDKFLAAGGAQSLRTSLDRKYLQSDLRSILAKSMKDRTLNIIKNPLEAMRALSELSEMGTRLGEFSKAMKKNPTPEGIRNAAKDARDLIDFSRAGTIGKSINKVSAFWNAQIQGLDKTRRVFFNKKNWKKSLAKASAMILAPTWALYEANKNDPRYQELAQWDKDLFWHFWVGDTHYRIPIPFELGVIFKVIPERLLSMNNGEEEPFRKFGETVYDTFYPAISLQILEPWIQAYANKTFSGGTIVPRREEGLLPEDQAGPYTSTAAKLISRIPGVGDNPFTDKVLGSPRKVDHLIQGYFGSLGKYATQLIDKGLEKSGVIKPPPKPEIGLEDAPLFKAVIGKTLSGNTDSVDKFYDKMDELSRKKKSANKKGNPFEEAGELKRLERISKRMSEISKSIRAIQEDQNMTGKEKTERIQSFNLTLTNLARNGLGKDPLELSDFFPSKKK